MKYNTQKENLIIREYGRNVQNMIAYAKTLEDKEERQAYIEKIVDLVMSMHPHTRNVEDYRLKVWSHVVQMADYELDVTIPENIPSTKERRIPDVVAYPNLTRRFRHYGRNVRTMIAKAKGMEDPEKQEAYIKLIASYMKMSYKEHNRESVQDDVIFKEFKAIANGDLEIPAGTNLDGHSQQQSNNGRRSSNSSSSRKRRANNTNKSKTRNKPTKNSNSRGRKR